MRQHTCPIRSTGMQPEIFKKITFKTTLPIIIIILTIIIIARVRPVVKFLGDLVQNSVQEIGMEGGDGKLK